jgi:triacylglycerol lipase
MSGNQKLPIILAHGIARFDILSVKLETKFKLPEDHLTEKFQYFKKIKPHLEAAGFTVSHPNQDFAGPVDLRAEQLRDRVNDVLASTGAAKVHIIAHSMGGLDARHMIVDKGMADRVASLTTIGTPHLGTVLADEIINHGGELLKEGLRPVINVDGLADLTTTACGQFNIRAEHQEATNSVLYQTYAASENRNMVFAPLVAAWMLIRDHEGRNDGLVPFKSQQWTPELIAADGSRKTVVQREFPLPADHLNEVAWWDAQEIVNPLGLLTLAKDAPEYERKIRDVYLEIAQNL